MTEAQKPVQPVEAWAIVDKYGAVQGGAMYLFLCPDMDGAIRDKKACDIIDPGRAPHRVIKVEI